MNVQVDNLSETYQFCMRSGLIKEKTADIELIDSLQSVALMGLDFIKRKSKDIAHNSSDWTFVFRDYYESLRGLIEAFALFDGIAIDNHQCKNAYVCFKHPELDLDWIFLETVRLKRNAINYRGHLLNHSDWNMLHMSFELHINTLTKELHKKLAQARRKIL